MNDLLFRAKTFPVEGSQKCACLIAGYRGRISGYTRVIRILNEKDYSVVAYDHSPTVLTKGNPDLLPVLVTQICNDFSERATAFDEVICVGASIGAGLCFAIQSKIAHVKFGVYAGAGVSPPDTIYEAPLFYFVRKKFTRSGIDRSALRNAWAGVDIVPGKRFAATPFLIALGKKDAIVKYDAALHTLQAWQSLGQPIRIITKTGLGHAGIIKWYKRHFGELLTEAEGLI